MSTVAHRQTLEVRDSVNTPEYDPSEWLINPTFPGVPKRYWIVEGDDLREATEEEKGPIDVKYLAEQKELRTQELREQYNEALESRYQTRTLLYANYLLTKAMASMNDEAVEYLASLAQWVEDGDVLVEAAEELIESSETPEDVQAVSLILTSWLNSDPKVSTRAARKL